MENKKLIALINTKTNYNNLNNKWVTIIQFVGSIVYCEFEHEQIKKRADFNLTEIIQIKEIN